MTPGRALRPTVAGALVLVAGCAAAASSGGGRTAAPILPTNRAGEWVTLRDFRYVLSVAASDVAAYFGTTSGLERFDTLRGTWLDPVTDADGLPDAAVTALVADPTNSDVWVGTRRGVVRFLPFTEEVERVFGPLDAPVDALLLDPRAGRVWARVGGTWWSGRSGSPILERSDPPTSLAGLEASLPVDRVDPADLPWSDPRMVGGATDPTRRYALTELDRDLRGDWYVGTWGDNGRRWGAGRQAWEELYFGLAGPGGGPIARSSSGWWFAPAVGAGPGVAGSAALDAAGLARLGVGFGERAAPALARADPDLQRWSYAEAGVERGLDRVEARSAVASGDTVWLATDAGLVRGTGREWRTWATVEGTFLGRVTALALDGSRLWVGTERGLYAWDRAADTIAGRFLSARRITGVAVAPDVVFVGTAAGLFSAPRAGPGALPDSVSASSTRGRDVRAVALSGARLVVATDVGLEAFDRTSGAWTVRAVDGGAFAVALDGSQTWAATRDGLARWRPETGQWREYGPEDGLAGLPVRFVWADDDAVWASTDAGTTRFAWRAAGGF